MRPRLPGVCESPGGFTHKALRLVPRGGYETGELRGGGRNCTCQSLLSTRSALLLSYRPCGESALALAGRALTIATTLAADELGESSPHASAAAAVGAVS